MIRIARLLAFVLLLPALALASGPDPTPRYIDHQVCKGGSDDGADCFFDSDCSKNKCVIDWVKGKGTTLAGEMTIAYDQEVRDHWTGNLTGYKAISVILDLKGNGQKRLFTETYMKEGFPTDNPQIPGWGGNISEALLAGQSTCDDFLYLRPESTLADQLTAMSNLPATKVPAIFLAKKTETWDESATTLGSALRCKVKIRFFNEP